VRIDDWRAWKVVVAQSSATNIGDRPGTSFEAPAVFFVIRSVICRGRVVTTQANSAR